MIERGQNIWTIAQVKSIASSVENQDVSARAVSSVLKNQFNMSFRKMKRVPIQANQPRATVLR